MIHERYQSESEVLLVEEFLDFSDEHLLTMLENDPSVFDSVLDSDDVRVERKMNDLLRLAKKQETELEKNLREALDLIYQKAESKEEPEFLKGFTEKERAKLARSIEGFEFTEGCSLACPNCGLNARPGVHASMNFGDLVYFFRRYGKGISREFYPYHASEPLDWKQGLRDYMDIHQMVVFYCQAELFLSTGYPKGAKEILLKLLKRDLLGRLSINPNNIQRLIADGLVTLNSDGEVEANFRKLDEVLKKNKEDYIDLTGENRQKLGRKNRRTEADKSMVGGIFKSSAIILKVDGFYNVISCAPDGENLTGTLQVKVTPETLHQRWPDRKKIKKVEDLLPHIIVDNMEFVNFPDETYVTGTNYATEPKRRVFAIYETDTHRITHQFDLATADDPENLVNKTVSDILMRVVEPEFKSEDSSLMSMLGRIPLFSLNHLDKNSEIYEFILEKYSKLIDSFWENKLSSNIRDYYSKYSLPSYFNPDDEYQVEDLHNEKIFIDNLFQLLWDILPANQNTKLRLFEREYRQMARYYLRQSAFKIQDWEKAERTAQLVNEIF